MHYAPSNQLQCKILDALDITDSQDRTKIRQLNRSDYADYLLGRLRHGACSQQKNSQGAGLVRWSAVGQAMGCCMACGEVCTILYFHTIVGNLIYCKLPLQLIFEFTIAHNNPHFRTPSTGITMIQFRGLIQHFVGSSHQDDDSGYARCDISLIATLQLENSTSKRDRALIHLLRLNHHTHSVLYSGYKEFPFHNHVPHVRWPIIQIIFELVFLTGYTRYWVLPICLVPMTSNYTIYMSAKTPIQTPGRTVQVKLQVVIGDSISGIECIFPSL